MLSACKSTSLVIWKLFHIPTVPGSEVTVHKHLGWLILEQNYHDLGGSFYA